jgi:pyruvate,water dikinase
MRGVGEIDITRARWGERPLRLLPVILGHIRNAEPGEARRRFERGQQQASQKEQDVLVRLRALPDGGQKPKRRSR